MTGSWIDGLNVPPVTFLGPCIEQNSSILGNPFRYSRLVHNPARVRPRGKISHAHLRIRLLERTLPGTHSAVEHCSGFVSEVREQEPETCGGQTPLVIIGNHARNIVDTDFAHGLFKIG